MQRKGKKQIIVIIKHRGEKKKKGNKYIKKGNKKKKKNKSITKENKNG